MQANEHGNTEIRLQLPDSTVLISKKENDPVYPRVGIFLHHPDGSEELICFVEHNGGDERAAAHQLCIGAYVFDQDDPAYYASYVKEGEMA